MKGRGILNWPRSERVTDRYGSIGLYDSNYDGTAKVTVDLDVAALRAMAGQRCQIEVLVLETRPSGHIGDLFRGISPTMPQVGESFDLGVGELFVSDVEGTVVFGLKPDEPRESDWFDPNKLYRLHDQTVEVTIRSTVS